jgi:hypothetical protein
MKRLLYILFLSVSVAVVAQTKIKIAYVGDGIITEDAVQEQLQRLLGHGYDVQNYGESNSTLLRNGNLSYWKTEAYSDAKKSKPDIVLIDIGRNDAKAVIRSFYDDLEVDIHTFIQSFKDKGVNRSFCDNFEKDIHAFIQSFKDLNPKTRFILILPFVSFEGDTTQIGDKVIAEIIMPQLQKAAYYKQIEVIDMYSFFDRRDLMPSKIHPAPKVSEYIAKRLLRQIMLPDDTTAFNLFNSLKEKVTNYSAKECAGYECATFRFKERNCKVVRPHRVAANKPWIWQINFSEYLTRKDIALLERGYHVVYFDQEERMGNKDNIQEGNSFYELLYNGGLNKKAVLAGKGRRAVYTFNWAAANRDKVAAVYVDNPFLDMISAFFNFEGHKKPESELSRIIRNNYDIFAQRRRHDRSREFKDNKSLMKIFRESPTDKIDAIAGGNYPILILYDNEDEAADHSQYTFLFAQNVKNKGGNITVMEKKNLTNDPHILSTSSYLVDFMESAFDGDACMPFKLYDSYKGLVMTGYRGWFSCPGDGSNRGWAHYAAGQSGLFQPESCSIDLWPDFLEYEPRYQTNFTFADGKPAYVYSAYDASSVETHFRWMREYGIDGAFIRRSVTDIKDPKSYNQLKKVWKAAIQAANINNRAISILYDLSGMVPGDEQFILDDLDFICAQYDIKERKNNTSYLFHRNKPLVAILGVGFNDRKYGFKEAETIIDGLKKREFKILIGVPLQWRPQKQQQKRAWGRPRKPIELNSELSRLIKKCNIVMPWIVGKYDENTFSNYEESIRQDMDWCRAEGVEYAPVAFPDFSGMNMGKGSQSIPRNNGSFYWRQLSGYIGNGAKMLYLATFDDMNEGTAIFKCATQPPAGFIVWDEKLGNDHYLYLSGQAAKMLRGKIPFTSIMPERKAK